MPRKQFVIFSLFSALLLVFSLAGCRPASSKQLKPNILFFFVDDMNDWAGALNTHPQTITPNMDKIAAQGVLFTNALCPAPLCTPSRASMFVGMRPDNTGVYCNAERLKNTTSGLLSLPVFFRNHGYQTINTGKTFTVGGDYATAAWDVQGPDLGVKGPQGGPFTEEEYSKAGKPEHYRVDRLNVTRPLSGMVDLRTHNRGGSFDWGPFDLPDNAFEDGVVSEWAAEQLRGMKPDPDLPFFMSVGFYRPHQPLYAPRKYFDLFPPESIKLPETAVGDLEDTPEVAKYFSLIAATAGLHSWVTEADQWKEAVAAYLACVNFADTQVGKVLQALEEGGHTENTIIVLVGDNGYHLGEKEHWGKFTGWQESTRVPMMISIPEKLRLGNPENKGFTPGTTAEFAASLIDIFPTLASLAELPPVEGMDGQNLAALLRDREQADSRISVSTFGRGNYVLARNDWRYIHYFDGSEELYNLEKDIEQFHNLIFDPSVLNVLETMRNNLPVNPDISWMTRMDQFKLVQYQDGRTILLDLTDPAGITDAGNITEEYPEITNKITSMREKQGVTEKYAALSPGSTK
jgi:arylsulfatase A-like enzyme